MSTNNFPEPWGSAASRVGINSYREFAERAGLSKPTVYSTVSGRTAKPNPDTVRGLAKALRLSTSEVLALAGMGSQPELSPYTPPDVAAMLTRRERDAVDELIRLLVTSRTRTTARLGETQLGETVLGDDPAPSQPTAPPPASDDAYNLARRIATNPDAYDLAAKHHEADPLDGLGEENQDLKDANDAQ